MQNRKFELLPWLVIDEDWRNVVNKGKGGNMS
jgi:hypothetical protein